MAFAVLIPAALAQQPGSTTTRPRAKATTSKETQNPKPIAQPRAATTCSEYGAGFVRMPGSDTCVRVGGSIDVGVGMSR
jgi:hypothetical protein